jgi:hypothetical protein
VADELIRRGHGVVAAVRDLRAAEIVFGTTPIRYLPAPFQQIRPRRPFRPTRSYAQLLFNAAFADEADWMARHQAWRTIFDLTTPDVIVFEHSPTALLASRGYPCRRVLLGTGFCAPPAVYPLPALGASRKSDHDRWKREEAQIVAVANRMLQRSGQPPLRHLCDVYGQVDANFLTTYAELDHFGPRPGASYFGTHSPCLGAPPKWPDGSGKRIFAYLKRTKGLPETLRLLRELEQPTIVYGDWVTPPARRKFGSRTLCLETQPLDLESVSRTCHIAILNGTHGATATFLLAGKPLLQLPIFLEQKITSERTVQLAAGLAANRSKPGEVRSKLDQLLQSERFRRGAEAFAARYASRDARRDFRQLIQQIEGFAG